MRKKYFIALAILGAAVGLVFSCTPPLLFYANGNNVDIPDFDIINGATSTIHVSHSFTIADVNIGIDIQHPDDGDLTAYVQSPEGTIVHLIANESGEDFVGTVFDDEANESIDDGTAPYSARFRIDSSFNTEALSDFDGEDAEGTWTLHVYDRTLGDTGSIQGWSLSFITD